MPHHPVLGADGVLVGTELLEAHLEKPIQPGLGISMADGISEVISGAEPGEGFLRQLLPGGQHE